MSGGQVPPVATLLVLESRPPPRGGEATFKRRGRAGFVHSLLCKVLDGGGVWPAGLWNHGQRTGGRTVALKAWLQGNTVCHAGLATCLGRQPLVLRPPPPKTRLLHVLANSAARPSRPINGRRYACSLAVQRGGDDGDGGPPPELWCAHPQRGPSWFCGEALPAAVHRRGRAVCNM